MEEKTITASEAEVGMILARPVHDSQGRVIMNEGSRLTPALIKRFSKWGIETIYINLSAESNDNAAVAKASSGQTENPMQQLDQEYMREMAAVFNERFHEVQGDSNMDALKKVAFKAVVLSGRGQLPGVTTEG
jgi:hypothetical protein